MTRPGSGLKSRTRAGVWVVAAGLALTLSGGPPAGADTDTPQGAALQGAIDRILADERLDGGAASVVVQDAESGDVLYAHESGDRLMPASNTKLATSVAATALLGTDHRFRTDVLADGRQRGRVLRGDLYLRGTGDPTILAEDYDKLAEEVADSGIKHVFGDLVADDTRFDDRRLGRSWAADDESAYYSSQISPLTVAPDTDYDAGTVYVEAAPGDEPGDEPKVTVTPPNDYVTVDVRGTTVAEGETDTLSIDREHGNNTLVIEGDIPVGANPTRSWTAVWEPTGLAAAVFADALADHGVRVHGDTRFGRAAPDDADVLAAHDSMKLEDLLVPFMKLSNNNHAEVLTKAVGHEVAGEGTWDAGLSAIEDYLAKEGVDTSTLRQVDGSGLSRMNNIPSAEFAQLLVSVRDAPWFDAWYASLPVACESDRMVGGTLRSRMCDTPAAGNVHAKTGSLTGASGLSGYVTDADGRELVFSILLNNYLASSVKSIEDAIAVTLASHGEDGTRRITPPTARNGEPPAHVECSWLKPRHC
ncbi:D-alanyl-D-alanine carboxypeptidase/D-alanyl-D-alanine-endopeptidase [Streptomyces sp. DSM 42041]|uniref:D-alanyl-D-alanine carboxypeptidase/D-alanyl-D-alanine-endopeptidase n=1 Tax=Streptomyces hazeniae TaxID=3075538 RepID=A0ABU2NKY8_9ACTN|nr:D-alanyl-D-alanine carboxypeptidase/D-alanyl-D-alanine-endopeptidase [Streptomyces sp. DSM 42041]MDT0377425.1 D-alanyl-D-alanine carboxypeptidase/D-alanyl-D-alanine-endopeptidase [Streptomyces sp. DSM 42041]